MAKKPDMASAFQMGGNHSNPDQKPAESVKKETAASVPKPKVKKMPESTKPSIRSKNDDEEIKTKRHTLYAECSEEWHKAIGILSVQTGIPRKQLIFKGLNNLLEQYGLDTLHID